MIQQFLKSFFYLGIIGTNFYLSADHSRCGHHSKHEQSCDESTSKSEFIIFEADVSNCRISIGPDRVPLESGTADFVTAFNGNDFTCSSIDVANEPVIQILPSNGSSFTFSNPPVPQPGPTIAGVFDHVKFLAYSIFAHAPINGGDLTTTWVGSGRQLNVDAEPYNSVSPGAVINPHEDPRLACFGFVSLDPALLLTADWICTDDVIYALYERLPGAEGIFGYYAAFTYLIPVFYREAGENPLTDYHEFQTIYNREKGTLTWKLDGKKVFEVNKIGYRLDEENGYVFERGKKRHLKDPDYFNVNDHGGDNVLIDPIGFQTGLSFFTLLDFYRPNNLRGQNNRGLVRLESSQFRAGGTQQGFFYNNPLKAGRQGHFVYDSPLDLSGLFHTQTIPASARIWGQGAELRLLSYKVSISES